MAAVQETAERFSEDKEEATWFLKNITYVGNATGNAHIKETAMRISQNIEDITENCVTCFKEMVLT
jgi:hypothetical protein